MRPLNSIKQDEEFFKGTIVRFYIDKSLFYDYLLTYAPWEENMMLVNITSNDSKRGSVYGGTIPIDKSAGRFVVNKKDLNIHWAKI